MPDPSKRWTEHLRGRLASLSLTPSRELEIIEELAQHLEERYEELRADGVTDAEAERQALAELLDKDALADHMRSLRQAHPIPQDTPGVPGRFLIGDFWQDLRRTMRTLLRQRAFSAAAILTLALGIGATTAIFSVVNGVLIRPLRYPNPDELVRIAHTIGGINQPYFSDQIYLSYVHNSRAFQDVGVWSPGATATIAGRGDPEEVRALRASRSLLTTLGVQPEIGGWFSTADDAPGTPGTVMLSHGYWHRRFGGDRGVLGQALNINGSPHQIIGVMPSDFRFGNDFEIILPLRINPGRFVPFFRLLGVARMKPGVTLAQANADVPRVLDVWFENSKTPPDVRARWVPALQPLKQDVVGDVGRTLWILMGAIGLVLLMACANVANLLLVRADARRQETTIRVALGASRIRIAGQLLADSLTLALLGGAIGVGVAYAGLRVLVAAEPSNLPRLSEIAIDGTVLSFAVMISLMSGLLFGLLPILKCAGPRVIDAVRGGRGTSQTRERQRAQSALVAAQMALALVLLVSAGLMIRSFDALRSVAPGFTEPEHVQTFGISIPPSLAADADQVTRMQHAVMEKIAAIPGVGSVAFTTRLPMDPTDRWSAALTVQGRPDDGRTPPNRQVKVISPGMFRTLGTPLVVGRDFTWTDLDEVRDVAIVSDNLAREFFGSPSAALGKRVREYYDARSPWREIVGVAGNVYDDGVHQRPPETIYWPGRLQGAYQPRRVNIAIRTDRAGTPGLLAEVGTAVWSVNSSLPLAQVSTQDEIYQQSMAPTSFTLVMLAIAGLMALLLGIAGVYGVIAYAVSQRRREIGIRIALGAQARDIRRLFVRRGLTLGIIGLAAGLAGALGFTRWMESLVFGVSPRDPITFAAMPFLLIAAALLASYLPARRAVAIDPVETMRAE